jgi:hypothetical protein
VAVVAREPRDFRTALETESVERGDLIESLRGGARRRRLDRDRLAATKAR